MYKNSHLEDYILEVYKNLGIEQPEQINRYMIAYQLNVGLYPTSSRSEALYWNGRCYIFINRQQSQREQWQDFGHELCPVLMHEGHQNYMYHLFRELQEWQADNFMYHFCIPTFTLRRIRLPPDIQYASFLNARTFNVEHEFARIRLDRYIKKVQSRGFQVAERQDSFY